MLSARRHHAPQRLGWHVAKGQTIRLVSHETRKRAHMLIERAPDGAVVNIQEAGRTLDQNAKLWACISDVSRAKPDGRSYPVEVWKALFMAEAGFKPIFEPSLDGQGVIPIGYKSSRLNKREFADLLTCVLAYGDQHGVQWSEPNPYD